MQPETVKPARFHQHTILYNDGEFSIAYGHWDNGPGRLAMRWNGDNDAAVGYPSQGGNPLWFQLPNTGVWTSEILKAIENIRVYEDQIDRLEEQVQ